MVTASNNASNPTDLDALMASLADGDRSAFTPVFRALWSPTLRVCRSIVKNEADAHDAAQESLAKILSRASDYDPSRPALPWALAIAAWECRTILRKRGRRKERSEEQAEEPGTTGAEEEFVHRDLVLAAVEAMGSLSESDKQTLLATFWDESASASGATFRKRRERALARLRHAFQRIYGIG